MTLKEFLAVGKSFAESPREKSPFEMRKDIRLPTFENSPRFTSKRSVAVQTDWLAEKGNRPVAPDAPTSQTLSGLRKSKASRKRRWLEILTFGLLGQSKVQRELIQEEMDLENLRVIRNDLHDSDLEVVVNKSKKLRVQSGKAEVQIEKVRVAEPAPRPEPKKREEWTRLTARLFELGQH